MEATEEAITVLKKDASKVVEAVGREGIKKKVKEVLMEKQLCCGLDTTKAEQYILAHLRPITEYADTYFCQVSKFRADRAMDNLENKVKKWAKKNGGKFCTVSEKKTIGDEKGYFISLSTVYPLSEFC